MDIYIFIKDCGGYKKGTRVQLNKKDAEMFLKLGAIEEQGDGKADKKAPETAKKSK